MRLNFSPYLKYLPIFGGFLMNLSIGSFYSAGHLKPYIDKYMGNNNKTLTWVFGSTWIGMGAAMSLGGYMEMLIGSSLTVMIGGWIMSANICLMCITMNYGLTVVILTYGLLAGFGTGIVYGVALSVPLKIVKKRIGLILGVVVSGFGISATIFDFLQYCFIHNNPQKLPESFLLLGCIYAIIQIIGGILMKTKANENDLTIQNKETSFHLFENDLTSKNKTDFKPHEILYEFDFWILWIIFFQNGINVTFITSLYNEYFSVPKHMHKLIYISTSGAAVNCLGRIFWGYVIDKKSFKTTMLIMTVANSILMALFSSISLMKLNVWYEIIFGILYGAINFVQSGSFSIFPFMCAQLYGTKYFVCNYGMLFTACSVSGTVVNIISTNVSTESIKFLFASGAALSVLSALVTLIYRGKSLIIRTSFVTI